MFLRFQIFCTLYGSAILLAGATNDCPHNKTHLAPVRLRHDLLCSYDKSIRPVLNHQNTTKVLVRMILKYFIFADLTSTFSIDSWIGMYWKDEHLRWNPSNYSGLKLLHLSTNEIWIPDISVYNRQDQSGDPAAVSYATCIISSNGQVVCVPPTRQSTLCVADLTRYPFDTQNCTVRLGSWVHSGEEIDFRLAQPPVTTEDLVPNGEWHLERAAAIKHDGRFKCCPNTTYPSLNFSFIIRRMGAAHSASVILPALALVVLTLTSLWIPPHRLERVYLCTLNIVCHFLFSQYVSWLVPLHGHNVPLIILFGRDSLLLCSISIVLSLALRNCVLSTDQRSPTWMSTIVSMVLTCKWTEKMLISEHSLKMLAVATTAEDATQIVSSSTTTTDNKYRDWPLFAGIVDRISFIIYFIVYACMFIAFTP